MQLQDLSYRLNNEIIMLDDICLKRQIALSMEIFSLENVYTIPQYQNDKNNYLADMLMWGDTEKVSGKASLHIESNKNESVCQLSCTLNQDVRGVKLRLEHLPLGTLVSSIDEDKKITERGLLLHYPEGWRSLSYPFLVFQLENNQYLYIKVNDNKIRPKRFYMKKMGNEMRVDICLDQDGTEISSSFITPDICWGMTNNLDEFYHKVSLENQNKYHLERFENSSIVPSWFKNISLVVTMHMEAFTGHIFHTYDSALLDAEKLAKLIDPKKVLIYFAGWEGRYYYKYGDYTSDVRLGGKGKLIDMVKKMHALGFKVMAMYGMNIANKNIPGVKRIYQEAEFETISGGKYHCGSVDWEGAHHYDFNDFAQLNIGQRLWQDYLFKQIKSATEEFDFDGAFLDIAACYTNDRNAKLYVGVVEFCDRLRTIKKDFLVSGEGFYDGLARAMPLFQSGHTDGWLHYHDRINEDLFTTYSREFAHLCLGDPSYGSSGVHELGINTEWKTPLRKGIIPTLSLVENSLDSALDKVNEIIAQSEEYYQRYISHD